MRAGSDNARMSRPRLCLIACLARNGAIGRNNQLLVHLPGDLPRFKHLTMGCPIIMGRKTWESIGRPLPGRRNIVVTRDSDWSAPGAEVAHSLQEAIAMASDAQKIFVIGGAQLYSLALPQTDELYLTEIDASLDGDAFFPAWDRSAFCEVSREPVQAADNLKFSYVHYSRIKGD